MTDQKLRRRYVYMSDAEWDWLRSRAGEATISSVVRSLVGDARSPGEIAPETMTVSGPGVGYGNSVIAETPPWQVRSRPAPKPAPRKRR